MGHGQGYDDYCGCGCTVCENPSNACCNDSGHIVAYACLESMYALFANGQEFLPLEGSTSSASNQRACCGDFVAAQSTSIGSAIIYNIYADGELLRENVIPGTRTTSFSCCGNTYRATDATTNITSYFQYGDTPCLINGDTTGEFGKRYAYFIDSLTTTTQSTFTFVYMGNIICQEAVSTSTATSRVYVNGDFVVLSNPTTNRAELYTIDGVLFDSDISGLAGIGVAILHDGTNYRMYKGTTLVETGTFVSMQGSNTQNYIIIWTSANSYRLFKNGALIDVYDNIPADQVNGTYRNINEYGNGYLCINASPYDTTYFSANGGVAYFNDVRLPGSRTAYKTPNTVTVNENHKYEMTIEWSPSLSLYVIRLYYMGSLIDSVESIENGQQYYVAGVSVINSFPYRRNAFMWRHRNNNIATVYVYHGGSRIDSATVPTTYIPTDSSLVSSDYVMAYRINSQYQSKVYNGSQLVEMQTAGGVSGIVEDDYIHVTAGSEHFAYYKNMNISAGVGAPASMLHAGNGYATLSSAGGGYLLFLEGSLLGTGTFVSTGTTGRPVSFGSDMYFVKWSTMGVLYKNGVEIYNTLPIGNVNWANTDVSNRGLLQIRTIRGVAAFDLEGNRVADYDGSYMTSCGDRGYVIASTAEMLVYDSDYGMLAFDQATLSPVDVPMNEPDYPLANQAG